MLWLNLRYTFMRKVVAVIVGIVLVWLILHLVLHRPAERPYLIAHRGAAGLAPENTLAAIRAGLESGAAYVEIDVQRTSDGTLILFHDAKLEGRPIGGYTYAELQSHSIDGEPIPTFDEALTLFAAEADDRTILLVEAKDPAKYPG